MSGLFDKRAALQIIGCLLQQPEILSQPIYKLDVDDFAEEFHKIVFSAISNLYNQGTVKKIGVFDIDSLLSKYPKQYEIFSNPQNNGAEYVNSAYELAELENFDYNYTCLKKFSLLRYYEAKGFDTRVIYDGTIADPERQEKEQEKFDNMSIDDIIGMIESVLVINPKLTYSSKIITNGELAGQGMREMVEDCAREPDIGIAMQSKFMNTILRGSRLKTVYLRSGGTGSGKSRLAIADSCCYSVPWFFDEEKGWIYTGFENPALIISCELTKKEVRMIILTYVSGVSQDIIESNKCTKEESARIQQAIDYIESSPLYIEEMNDFDIDDITYVIKKYKREHGVQYVNFDYLHTTIKLLIQMSSLSKGMKLQEFQVLYMFADRLKVLANSLDIHIDTATQLNGDYKNQKIKDQDVLRGSKAIPDRFDAAYIAMPPNDLELKAIEPILRNGIYPQLHDKNCIIYHVYKVRAGKLTRLKVFMHVDLGTSRVKDLFCTTYDHQLIPVEKLTIEHIDATIEENSEDIRPEDAQEEKKKFTF